jgi:phage-related protein
MATMNLGTLYVQLSADSKAFLQGMSAASDAVKKFATGLKETSQKFASMSGLMLAMGGAAVKLASSVDGRAAKSMASLERNTRLLAVQVADVLEPAVRSLSSGLRDAANWFAGLDSDTKKAISTFATWAAGIAVAAKAIGAASSVLAGLASVVSGVATAIGAIGLGPILVVLGAVALLAAGIAALHYAFRTNLGGIADMWKKLVDWLADVWGDVFGWLSKTLDAWVKHFLSGVELLLKGIASLYGAMGDNQKKMGFNLAAGAVATIRESFSGTQIFKHIVSQAFDFGKETASQLWDGFVNEWKLIAAKPLAWISEKLSIAKGAARQPVGLGPPQERVSGPIISGAIDRSPQAGSVFGGKVVVAAGREFLWAMDKLTRQQERHARELERAQEMQRRAAFDLAQAQVDALKMARASATGDLTGLTKKQIAEVTKDTGGAWSKLTKAQRNFVNFARRMSDTVLGAMGEVGQAVQNVMAGISAGGVWGAIIAAIMELLRRSEGFQKLMAVLGKTLERLGEFLNLLLGKIFEVIGELSAVGTEILAPIFEALKPLFDAIASALKDTAPLLGLVGFLFKAIAPLLGAIASSLSIVFKVLSPVLRILFEVAKVVLIVIMGFLEAIASIWNAIVDAVAGIVQAVLTAITLGAGAEWAKGVADEIRKGKADTTAMREAREALNDATWDSVAAQNAQMVAAYNVAEANDATAKTAREVAEALTNVPSGYKVALARFNAMDPGRRLDYSKATGGRGVGGGGGGGATTIIYGDVNISADGQDAADIAERIKATKRRLAGQRRGNVDDDGV